MRFIKKQLVFLLTVIIIAVQFSYAALAEPDVSDVKIVESFSALGDDMKKQTVPTGTEQEERPDTATPSQAERDTDILDEDDVVDDKLDDAYLTERVEGMLQMEPRFVGNTSVQLEYTVDGKKKDSISFYAKRNSSTNVIITPEPVVLRITQTGGEDDAGPVLVMIGVPNDPDKGLKDQD